MNSCYIIYSPSFDKFYVGVTHENVMERLSKHNNKTYKNSFTAYTNDWELFLEIKCDSFPQAVNIEKHIKRMKSKIYIRNLKIHSEIIDKLLLKYK